jgi:hypothetical protein
MYGAGLCRRECHGRVLEILIRALVHGSGDIVELVMCMGVTSLRWILSEYEVYVYLLMLDR